MPTANSDKNGAEVLLEQLESQGAECVFASPIAALLSQLPSVPSVVRRGSRGACAW